MRTKAKGFNWVVVRVERGFPVEVQGFRRKSDAEKKEREWRKTINPDYDETEVLPLIEGEA
ncbi:MAG: hypothetical protein FJ134_12985 [Deltaproteobacteria bacterium]|nr:hypothetical protein [Deltaproteobacteria bacterium]